MPEKELEKENVTIDYEFECERLNQKIQLLEAAIEKSNKENEEYIKTISEASQKEITWLKAVINSILHIQGEK